MKKIVYLSKKWNVVWTEFCNKGSLYFRSLRLYFILWQIREEEKQERKMFETYNEKKEDTWEDFEIKGEVNEGVKRNVREISLQKRIDVWKISKEKR